MTALFADKRVANFGGYTNIRGGFINRHFMQLAYQLAECGAILGWTFVVTLLILVTLDFVPGLSLRVSEDGEDVGVDEDQVGELA